MRIAACAAWDRRGFGHLFLVAVLLCSALVVSQRRVSAADGYVVEYGDTLSAIADAYGLSIQELMWLNGIDDPDLIYAGEYLTVAAAGDDAASDDDWSDPDADWTEPNDEGGWQQDDELDDGAGGVPPYVDPWTIQDYLAQAAWMYGWDPNLVMALAWQESGWQQDQVSWVGAIGVMQLMPSTATSLDDWYFERELDVWADAWDNIEAGVAYLSMLYHETGSVELALAGYYQGLGSVYADGMFPETDAYVANVLLLRDLFQEGVLP